MAAIGYSCGQLEPSICFWGGRAASGMAVVLACAAGVQPAWGGSAGRGKGGSADHSAAALLAWSVQLLFFLLFCGDLGLQSSSICGILPSLCAWLCIPIMLI
jgi:hypothetical protein